MRSHLLARLAPRTGISLLMLVATAALAFGQASTGTIVGTVRDSSGAVLPGVSVTIRNEGPMARATS